MKKLIALIAAILSTQSLLALDFTSVKVSDGTRALCKSKSDQIRNRAGAYRFKALDAKMDTAYTLHINFALQFLKCAQTRTGFQMTSALPYEDYRYQFANLTTVNTIEEVKVKAYRDGQYDILMDEPLRNSSLIKLSFDKDIASILTEREIKELDTKGEVRTSVDFFVVKKVATKNAESEFTRDIPFGSFRVHVKLQKKDGQIQARLQR